MRPRLLHAASCQGRLSRAAFLGQTTTQPTRSNREQGRGVGVWLTSSTGSSFRRGRELESRPMRKGVGEHTMSIMEGGSTGM